jgi:ribosomal protein S18 acetylase RimI-like enzyme
MNPSISVRPVTLDDAAKLQSACYPYSSVDAVRELIQRALDLSKRGRGVGMVAVNESAIVGYGQLTLWPRAAEISDMIVTETLRSKGIGSTIIDTLLEKCRLLHLPKVEIGAALSNPRALALYRRLGFRDDRIIDIDLGDGIQPVMYLVMHFS